MTMFLRALTVVAIALCVGACTSETADEQPVEDTRSPSGPQAADEASEKGLDPLVETGVSPLMETAEW